MGLDYRNTFAMKTIVAEFKSPIFWRDAVVEGVVCTLLTIFVMLILITNKPEHYTPNTTHFGVFVAFVIYVLLEGYGPICGATLNPAVSISLCASGHITLLRAIVFIIAQLTGTAAGSGLGYLLNAADKRSPFPSLKPSASLTDVQCVFIEAVLAFNLLFVAISVNDKKNRPSVNLPSLAVAMCAGMDIFIAGTHTGGLHNPLVPLGPAIMNGDFTRYWIYWIGPCLGGTAGALTYELVQWIKVRFDPKSITLDNTMAIMEVDHHNDYLAAGSRPSTPDPCEHELHFVAKNIDTHFMLPTPTNSVNNQTDIIKM